MTEQQKQSWRPGKRDVMFLAMVAAVVLLLVLGTGDRTTAAVPADDVHRATLSRAACVSCHWPDGDQPESGKHTHTKADQCFQCHAEPRQGESK